MLRQTSLVTGVTTYAYDAAGNLTSTTDGNGATTARMYDSMGRVVSAVSSCSSDTETVAWNYDDASAGPFSRGRVTLMTDPSGSTGYSYDRRGLLTSEDRLIGATQYSTRYGHDADGNAILIGDVNYTYDLAGRPQTAELRCGPACATPLISSATYLPYGPEADMVFGNATVQHRTYDSRYRMLTNQWTTATGLPLSAYQYASDAAGNILAIHDVLDPTYNRDFAYDDLSRLITANSGSSFWGPGTYTYDSMGNMTSSSIGTSRSFAYAGSTPKLNTVVENGAAISVTYDAEGNEIGGFLSTLPQTYSCRNLLGSSGQSSPDCGLLCSPAPLLGSESDHFTYDGRGVRVTSADAQFEESAEGAPPPRNRQYLYTPELRLMKRVTTAGDVTSSETFVWFGGRPVAQISNSGAVRYTFTDHLGTPLAQTDASSAIVWRAEYEPYGNVFRYRAGTPDEQPLRLPGQELASMSSGAEVNYNIFRWYRSGWGRYTQSDPLGITPSLNLYSYVGENPVRFSDPSGLMRIDSSCLDCPCKQKMMKAVSDFNKYFAPGWSDRNPACRQALVTMGASFSAPDGTTPITCMSRKTRDMVVKCAAGGTGCGGPLTMLSIDYNTVWVQPGACSGLCGDPVNTLFHEALHNCGAPDERFAGGYIAGRIADICVGR